MRTSCDIALAVNRVELIVEDTVPEADLGVEHLARREGFVPLYKVDDVIGQLVVATHST
ncbi:MAG: hypothetical protein J1F05_07275 [Muribaculaceae bacterium]|nr:hypothetical protein [Muribaculaceae bacterium]